MSFSFSLRESDFEEVNKDYPLQEIFGGPFAFAGRTCAGRVRKWAMERNPPVDISQVEFIFEAGIKGWGDLVRSMERDGFLSPTKRQKSRDYPPLQAADLIAWEFHKAMKQAFGNDLKSLRRSFEALLEMPGDNGVFSNADELLEKCIKPLGIKPREQA